MRLISWNVNGRYGRALPKQVSAVRERAPDLVALQEVRAESLPSWRTGLREAGLEHVLDSADLLGTPGPSGRDYRRRYFNLIAARWPLRRLVPLEIAFPERYLGTRVESGHLAFELHNAHLPPGSTRGLIKVEMFEALHVRLRRACDDPRILCGDFNTPRSERPDGTVEFWGDNHPRHAERWNAAERSVMLGLARHDLPDLFRSLNGYAANGESWVHRRGEQQVGRRYDHVFASPALCGTTCRYHNGWRAEGISDHSAIEADFAPPFP